MSGYLPRGVVDRGTEWSVFDKSWNDLIADYECRGSVDLQLAGQFQITSKLSRDILNPLPGIPAWPSPNPIHRLLP